MVRRGQDWQGRKGMSVTRETPEDEDEPKSLLALIAEFDDTAARAVEQPVKRRRSNQSDISRKAHVVRKRFLMMRERYLARQKKAGEA